ncbi:MAG: hypothetical protein M0Q48_08900 [Verrucomicrobia bacterium]|nr:hypothetical protein [Verrucomicrobiota bacterium]
MEELVVNAALTSTYAARIENIPAMKVHGSNGTTNCYYLKDLANTALALANSSGSIVESYDTMPTSIASSSGGGRRQGARQFAGYINSGIATKGRLIFYSVGK